MALRVRDEVEVVGVGGGTGGFERGDAWVGDGAGRQAGMAIGVVGRGVLQVGLVDGASIAVFQQGGVDDAGVGGERHVLCEAVDEDAGDEGRSESCETSFSMREARMTVWGRLCAELPARLSWAETWRKRWTMAASMWRGVSGG